jgi:hypothetical protein
MSCVHSLARGSRSANAVYVVMFLFMPQCNITTAKRKYVRKGRWHVIGEAIRVVGILLLWASPQEGGPQI